MTTKEFDEKLEQTIIKILFGKEGIVKNDGSGVMSMIENAQKSQVSKAKQAIKDLILNDVIGEDVDNSDVNLPTRTFYSIEGGNIVKKMQRKHLYDELNK